MDQTLKEVESDDDSTVGALELDTNVEVWWRDDERVSDLLAQATLPADRKLMIAFGDTVHRNDGCHLDGGIAEDDTVQALYDKLMEYLHGMYSPPKGGVGK